MTNLDLNMVNSVLNVKASTDDNDAILNDLNLPQGKSIAQLIYEQKNKEENTTKENEENKEKDQQPAQ